MVRGKFVIICTNDYDRDIDILMPNDPSFNASIPRNIEPQRLKFYDSDVTDFKGKTHLKVLSMIGDELFLDTIDLEMAQKGLKQSSHLSMT